jgi:hypothetical protein
MGLRVSYEVANADESALHARKEISKSARSPLFSRRDAIAPARSLVAPPVPTAESRKKDAAATSLTAADSSAFNIN